MNTPKKPTKKVTVAEIVAELKTFPRAYKLTGVFDLCTPGSLNVTARRVGGVIAVSYHKQALEGLQSRLIRMTTPDTRKLLIQLGFVSAETAADHPLTRRVELRIVAADDVMDGPL